ncbi:hypothetical protein [Blastococcus sp. CT_GayMR16]|uniref:hypothetical protein n=1 Tax=Blastococcus sp. CT_GayMR16 TaxID=2559607 RepID=UPI0010730A67|nr:hypothetical protein [Blastococcus sp. CT_GayMR16]TFV88592.1 hypothetical protein E4P38_10515 [Blastococcus sp. CT_GayMR16]
MLVALAVAVTAALFLHALYRVVQVNWPNSYFSQSSELELKTSSGRVRYACFRFGPVFVAAAFAAVTTARADESALLSVVALWALHTGDTSGRTLLNFLRRKARGLAASVSQAALAIATGLALAAVCVLAWTLRNPVDGLIPEPEVLVEALWTAAFAGIVAAFLLRASEGSADVSAVVTSELSKLRSGGLVATLHGEADENGVSREFLETLMIAESLERPRWFRQLERLFAFTRARATYGVMQVSSARALTDEESIAATAAAYRGYRPAHTSAGPIEPYLRAALARHNPDAAFIELAYDIYLELVPPGIAATRALATDGRPVVEVAEAQQVIDQWQITGTASASEATLLSTFDSGGGAPIVVSVDAAAPGRGGWRLLAPLHVREVRIWEPDEMRSQELPDRSVTVTTHYVF